MLDINRHRGIIRLIKRGEVKMNAARYNPLVFSEKLKKSGVSNETANLIANEQAEIVSTMLNNNMATKEDISDLKMDMKMILTELRSLENRMTIKFGAMMMAGVGLLSFVMK